ncbi:MAG: hypothetical protein GWO07_10810 [Candidatus Dadabacteria bacterium]|nr:hypothetical protein [Candidatus Dadabacteria bacterium]NIS09231.1 hypothetical protein [Candidatus Dadabacteria bacterium]NIV41879.1 hypothetical protein [Candidatus Dadabacteria bacterium]NIY22507.1 hypothetical protein [Candidatus Dadabacteria bacterium]
MRIPETRQQTTGSLVLENLKAIIMPSDEVKIIPHAISNKNTRYKGFASSLCF